MPQRNELFKVMGIVGMKGNGRLVAWDMTGRRRRRWLAQQRGHAVGFGG